MCLWDKGPHKDKDKDAALLSQSWKVIDCRPQERHFYFYFNVLLTRLGASTVSITFVLVVSDSFFACY